ncbi:cytochrome P450 [Deinococcus sp. Arct2-2]|uniref:cytochrome P450 family protein n=1 Tax=Deinococcus sp. Arct2-2 TaxID=2568653 RepID=UPI0010A40807|nr:cytochrome P450 [Deinococcus sp. Arct2-2]THF71758.1 cytochrome P450 [Deinococcus sp. Arct2-2]
MTPADLLTVPLDSLTSLNITDPAFKADPFPFYARLREEAPVFPVTLKLRGQQRAWLITRYEDVLAVLKDDKRFVKDKQNAMSPEQLKRAPKLPPMFGALQRNLLSLDGADHDRLKVLVHQAFTPRRVEGMRDLTQAVTDAALGRAERVGHMDLVADFALPVPLTIIGRILGVPEQDNATFNRGMTAFVAIGGSPNPLLIPPLLSFVGYLRKLIKTRRARPGDDLISALVQAQDSHDHLTDDEILAMVFLLLSAGHETTVNLIGSGVLELLRRPDQLARLRDDPGLIKSGVEELVRYVVPAETATERYAAQDMILAGTRIPKGELVLAVIASANRDPAVFQNPDTLDVGRQNNKHLSFGQGMHYCLGAPLSRLEAQIAIGTLLRRAPNLRLSAPPSGLQWRKSFIVRGLQALPVML